jgi:hypothetical protein
MQFPDPRRQSAGNAAHSTLIPTTLAFLGVLLIIPALPARVG